MLRLYLLLFIGCHPIFIEAQGSLDGWQSLLSLSNWGMKFSPIDEQVLLLSDINAESLQVCYQTCHENILCRIFDFDGQSNRCRLFEGNTDRRPCTFCALSRYLTCLNCTCQCPARTYFDGSICRSQNLIGGSMKGTTIAGGNGPESNNNQSYQPQALCVSKKTGAIYIADTYNNRITRWNPGATSGVNGTTAKLLDSPAGIALSQNETYLYGSDLNNNRIQRFELI